MHTIHLLDLMDPLTVPSDYHQPFVLALPVDAEDWQIRALNQCVLERPNLDFSQEVLPVEINWMYEDPVNLIHSTVLDIAGHPGLRGIAELIIWTGSDVLCRAGQWVGSVPHKFHPWPDVLDPQVPECAVELWCSHGGLTDAVRWATLCGQLIEPTDSLTRHAFEAAGWPLLMSTAMPQSEPGAVAWCNSVAQQVDLLGNSVLATRRAAVLSTVSRAVHDVLMWSTPDWAVRTRSFKLEVLRRCRKVWNVQLAQQV